MVYRVREVGGWAISLVGSLFAAECDHHRRAFGCRFPGWALSVIPARPPDCFQSMILVAHFLPVRPADYPR